MDKIMVSSNALQRIITGLLLVSGLWTAFFYCPPFVLSAIILGAMSIMLVELKNMVVSRKHYFLLAVFYPIIPCLLLVAFNQTPSYRALIGYIFLLVFTFDSASYLAGKFCSKLWSTHKIIPAISPGKSWEGFCGGLFATTGFMVCITKNMNWHTCLLSLIICSIAFSGDIFESYLKRSAGIKDSGTMLPGHGGLLDRFDAILFVSYFFFIFRNHLITILGL